MAPNAPHPDVLVMTTHLMTKVIIPVLPALHAIAVPVLHALHAIAVEVALATRKTVLAAAAINATPPTPPTPPPMTTNLANTPSAGMSTVVAAIPPLRHLKMHMPACPKGGDLIAGQVQTTMMTVHHACVCHQSGRDCQHPLRVE